LDNGRFVGNAGPALESAIASAQFVLIGEDHITREIPQFTTAVCDLMAPQGLSAMAVEAGPQLAEFVSSSFGKPGRLARMFAFTQRYPDSVAFLNVWQENDRRHIARKSLIPLISVFGVLIKSSLAQRAGCLTRLRPRIPARRQPPLSRDLKATSSKTPFAQRRQAIHSSFSSSLHLILNLRKLLPCCNAMETLPRMHSSSMKYQHQNIDEVTAVASHRVQ
jgi:hypothetical protein